MKKRYLALISAGASAVITFIINIANTVSYFLTEKLLICIKFPGTGMNVDFGFGTIVRHFYPEVRVDDPITHYTKLGFDFIGCILSLIIFWAVIFGICLLVRKICRKNSSKIKS